MAYTTILLPYQCTAMANALKACAWGGRRPTRMRFQQQRDSINICITKDISGYSPYNVAMRKTAGGSEARQVQAPESKIGVKHMGAKKRMPATSRIPVSRTVWAELAKLKKPGETYDHLLAEMIEREKKNRFFEDMDRIEKRGKFVAMEW